MSTSFANYQPAPVTPVFKSLQVVEKLHGLSPFSQIGHIFRATVLKRNIEPLEYHRFRMYAPDDEGAGARDGFIGHARRRKVNRALNQFAGGSGLVLDDKLLFPMLLERNAIPTTETVAVYHASKRPPCLTCLSDAESFAAFLRDPALYPLFGKPLSGSLSLGTLSMERYDAETDRVELSTGESVAVGQMVEELVSEYGFAGYILQRRLSPHPDLATITGTSVGTVRLLTLNDGEQTRPYYAVWKIPKAGSPADNFWRDGHMIALVDVETGRVKRVQRGTGVAAEEITRLGEDGPELVGFQIPDWDALVETALRAAAIKGAMRVIGWDIAPTDKGPVIVEANGSPDHGLYQMVARRGVLRDGFLAAYERAVADAKERKRALKAINRRNKRDNRRRQIEAFGRSSDFKSVLGQPLVRNPGE